MKRILSVILLLCLALSSLPALSEDAPAQVNYPLPYEGTVIDLYILPNGDLLHHGSYRGFDRPDMQVECSVIRSTPEGEIVWQEDFQYRGETGIRSLHPLPDGRYLFAETTGLDDGRCYTYFIDVDEGVVDTGDTVTSQRYYAFEGGIMGTDIAMMGPLTLRFFDGGMQETHSVDTGTYASNPHTIRLSDGWLISAFYYGPNGTTLLRTDNEGTTLWEEALSLADVFEARLVPDGQDGAYLLCNILNQTSEIQVRALDGDGVTRWTSSVYLSGAEMPVAYQGENGLVMLFTAGSAIQFGTLTEEEGLVREPVQHLPIDAQQLYARGHLWTDDGTFVLYGGYARDESTFLPFVITIPDAPAAAI